MWCHVKEKQNFIEFDLRNVRAKKHKKTKKVCVMFRSIIFISPIPKLWSRKKVIFKVFVFWRYSKTLSKIDNLLDKHSPLKTPSKRKLRTKSKPWITPALSNSIKTKNKLYKQFCKTTNPESKKQLYESYMNPLKTTETSLSP